MAPFTFAENVEDIPARERQRIRRAAQEKSLEILGLHWLLVKPPGLHLTHPDKQVRGRTAQYLASLARFAADLGGKVLVLGSPKQRNLLPGVSSEAAQSHAREVLETALPAAQECGVTLALEPLGPKETTFLQTAEETIAFIERIGHPSLRLNLDVKAMSAEATTIPDIIRASSAHLAHFQANDPNLRGPGMGHVRYDPILGALHEIGYDGWVSVEAFDFSCGAEKIASESIAYLREVESRVRP